MVGSCNIMLLGGGRFITNYDNLVEERLKKRRLLGERPAKWYEYTIERLDEIARNSERVILNRPSIMVYPYKSAFDVAYEHVDEFDKLLLTNFVIDKYEIEYRGTTDDKSADLFNTWTIRNSVTTISEWNTAFARAISLIYGGYICCNQKFEINYDEDTNILDNLNKLGNEAILAQLKCKYEPVDVLIRSQKTDDHIKTFIGLYKEMQGKVLPVMYSTNVHTTEWWYAKKYTLLVPKNAMEKFTHTIYYYGKLCDNQTGWSGIE